MLDIFKVRRVGFNKSLGINDTFESDGEIWVVRFVESIEVKKRRVVLFGNKPTVQKDVIEARVVAQKSNTFSLHNRNSVERSFQMYYSTKNIDENEFIRSGKAVKSEEDGRVYIVTQIVNARYSFVDMRIDFFGNSITELTMPELKEILRNKKIESLGWEVVHNKN